MSRRLQHELEKTFVDRTNCLGLWICFDAIASGCFGGRRHWRADRLSISLSPSPLPISISLLRRRLRWPKLLLVARTPSVHTAAPPFSPCLVVNAASSAGARREWMSIQCRALGGLGIRFSIARLVPATAVAAAIQFPCEGRVPFSGARASNGSRTVPAHRGRVADPIDASWHRLLFATACGRLFPVPAAPAALEDSCATSVRRFW